MIAWMMFLLGIKISDANPQSARTTTEPIHAEEYVHLNRVVNRTVRRIQRRRIMGSVVLVAHQDQIVYVDSRGWLHKKERKEMEIDSIWGCTRCRNR